MVAPLPPSCPSPRCLGLLPRTLGSCLPHESPKEPACGPLYSQQVKAPGPPRHIPAFSARRVLPPGLCPVPGRCW